MWLIRDFPGSVVGFFLGKDITMLRQIFNRAKGEGSDAYNARANRLHVKDWVDDKKSKGTWLPKEEFERKTGRPGKKI